VGIRLRLPAAGTKWDYAAIPVGLALIVGVGVLVVPRATHWWRCNSGTPGAPAWSPDGSSLAFGQPTSCGTRIATIEFPSGAIRPLTHGISHGLPAWAPRSNAILYSNGANIVRLDLASGQTRVLVHGVFEFGATWSPRGDELAYTHGNVGSPFDGGDGTTTVYIAAIDGSKQRRLLGHNVNGGTPAWSPNGKEIAVVGYDGLYIVRADGTRLRRILKQSFNTPGTPSWSPDGRMIAFVSGGEIDAIDETGRALRTIAKCACHTQIDSASWSPNGDELAFSAAQGIYLVRANGTHLHRLVRY
jgi:dipeptidyl aminopeptidase/acylaminoacyl peptidase